MSVDLNQLKDQLAQKQEELNAENQKGGTANAGIVEKLQQEIADITAQIDAANEAAQNAIFAKVDEIKISGMSLRDLIVGSDTQQLAEMAYQAISAAWKQSLIDLSNKEQADKSKLEQQLADEKKAKSDLLYQYDELFETTSALKNELNNTKLELEDTQAKRDTAARQLEEANKEIERLNSQVDDLRKEIAVGAANAAKVIDTGADSLEEWKAAKAAAEAAKPAIYDMQPLDIKQSRFTAKLAATDEVITFGYLEKGKYREVTAEEAEVFRADYLKQQAEAAEQVKADDNEDLAGGSGADLTLPAEPQFQDEDQPVNGLDETNTDVEMAGEAVTRQEFEELKARVAQLEGTNSQGSAA